VGTIKYCGSGNCMKEPETCGQGLVERSARLAKMSALTTAMAQNLGQHQRTLVAAGGTDNNAKAEHDAYDAVAKEGLLLA
jgi:hypothetical protein